MMQINMSRCEVVGCFEELRSGVILPSIDRAERERASKPSFNLSAKSSSSLNSLNLFVPFYRETVLLTRFPCGSNLLRKAPAGGSNR